MPTQNLNCHVNITRPKNTLKRMLCLFLLSVVVSVTGCSGQNLKSNWAVNPIVVDGIGNEWESYLSGYDEKLDLAYAAANDDRYLNLMLRFRDRRLARKMNTPGAVLWLNGAGKKKKDFGIRYINKNALPQDFSQRGEFRRSEFSGQAPPGSMLPSSLTGSYALITGDDTLSIPPAGLEDLKAAADYQDGVYCFEFRVPLQPGEQMPYALDWKKGKKIKIGLEIEAVSEEMRQRIKERITEGRPGGGISPGGQMPPGGGMMGRGRRPGGMNGGPGGMMRDFEAQETWITLLPAEKSQND